MTDQFGVRIEGVRELVRAIGKVDATYRKDIGQANKAIGQRIIDAAFPKPVEVGSGPGARPRASANTTVLQIVAGGSWRAGHEPVALWGRRGQRVGRSTSIRSAKRPYIHRAAEQQLPQAERDYLNILLISARRAGLTTKKG